MDQFTGYCFPKLLELAHWLWAVGFSIRLYPVSYTHLTLPTIYSV